MALTLPANWGQYLGNGTMEGGSRGMSTTTPEGWDQALNWVRQFDPNAAIRGSTLGSENDPQQYLSFNEALLPQNVSGGQGIEGINNLQALADRQYYRGPAPRQDPNFGLVGDSRANFADPTSMVDIVGPLVVGGAMGLGALAGLAPGMASAGFDTASSGAFAAGGGGGFSGTGGSFLGNLISKLPNVSRTLSGMMSQPGSPIQSGQAQPQITPQQLALLRMLALQQQQGGGG